MMAVAGNMESIKVVLDRVDGRVRDEGQLSLPPAITVQTNILVTSAPGTTDIRAELVEAQPTPALTDGTPATPARRMR